ncbi:hypothetical protein SAMN05216338_100955 [Bradyrhizobium sp. Rc2d]|nr:hypothetical protein SAMN05216338_100955 [Bradyrhizobium sp. Rc2d]
MRVVTLQGSQTQALHFAMMAISSDATICHCSCWAAALFLTPIMRCTTRISKVQRWLRLRCTHLPDLRRGGLQGSRQRPFLGRAQSRLCSGITDDFSKKGWSGAILDIRTDTMETTLSTVGIRTTNSLQLGHVTSTARTDLGWRNAFGDYIPLSTGSFAGARPSIISASATARLQFGSAPFPI